MSYFVVEKSRLPSPSSISGKKPPVPKKTVKGRGGLTGTANNDQNLSAIGISRPPTSASNCSITPSYITPPQSPSHNKILLDKFYPVPELEFNKRALPQVHTKSLVRRTVQISRQSSGDFGFSLRRASVTDKVSQPLTRL